MIHTKGLGRLSVGRAIQKNRFCCFLRHPKHGERSTLHSNVVTFRPSLCRSYTIVSTSKSLSTDICRNGDLLVDEDELLATAFNEAAEILALAKRKESFSDDTKNSSSSTSSHSTSDSKRHRNLSDRAQSIESMLDISDEANAVEGLLRLTSHPQFSSALSKYRELKGILSAQNDVVISLHHAFISVVHWLCNTLSLHTSPNIQDKGNFYATSLGPSKESILLTHILHLTERSRELNLPLSIPQYHSVCAMIAKHSSSPDIAPLLLDLSRKVQDIYGEQDSDGIGPIQPHFFTQALKELLKRDRIADMVELIQGMNDQYNFSVDLQTGVELLSLLKIKVDDCMSGSMPTNFEESDAMELTLMLQQPVMDELSIKKQKWEEYNRTLDVAFGHLLIEEDDDEEEEDFDNDDDDDEEEEEVLDDEFFSEKDEVKPYPPSDHKSKYEKMHQSMVSEIIYLRDDASWEIPDITSQLREWNPDKELFFTKDFEEDLLEQIIDEEDDEYEEGTHGEGTDDGSIDK